MRYPSENHTNVCGGIDEIDARRLLAQACRDAGGQKAWCELHGISRSTVCHVLSGVRVMPDTVAGALGLARRVRFFAASKKEITDGSDASRA
jgi:hypothetical protein